MNDVYIYYGSDIKLQVLISDLPNGLTMQDVDFTCTFRCGNREVVLAKAQLKNPKAGVYLAPIQSRYLDHGDLFMTISVTIPDTDFASGARTEFRHVRCGIKII